MPAAAAIASDDEAFARQVARDLHSPLLRLYANADLVGVEVGGAVRT